MISLKRAEEISREKIATLHKDFRAHALAWYEARLCAGAHVLVYEGIRSHDRQDQLYAIGRTAPGRVVTNARGGQSWHNYGMAIDWVPLKPAEKADNMFEADWNNEAAYKAGNEAAIDHSMRSLSWEAPHLEFTFYKTWHELEKKFGHPK